MQTPATARRRPPLPFDDSVRPEIHPDRLDLRVQLESSLAHLTPEAALLVATKRRRRVEHVVAVDPDRTRLEAVGEAMRLVDVARPDGGGEAVGRVVAGGEDLARVLERRRADDRAEDL